MKRTRPSGFLCVCLVLAMIGSMLIPAGAAEEIPEIPDVLKDMYPVSVQNFEAEAADTAVAETAFAADWFCKAGTGVSRIYEYNGKKMLMSNGGTTLTSNGTVSYELMNTYFGPSEAYAVSLTVAVPASGSNTTGYLFLRGTQTVTSGLEWYATEGHGSFRGGSGVSFRWQADGKIEIAVRYYDAAVSCKVNTKFVRLSAPANVAKFGSTLEMTAYDDGAGTIFLYLDNALFVTVAYSGETTYGDGTEAYYGDVTVRDASGTSKLTVTDALLAKQGRIAISQVGNQFYMDEIGVYSADYKLRLTDTSAASGNMSLLTGSESTKRGFPSMDTFVYFRNSGGMALNLGNLDLGEFESVSLVWWDAACGSARSYGAGTVNFALTSTGSLDTVTAKQQEQAGVNKLASWSLNKTKSVTAKEDYKSAETITLPLDTDYDGTVYLAYMGTINAIAVSQITFKKAEKAETAETGINYAQPILADSIALVYSATVVDDAESVQMRFTFNETETVVDGISGDDAEYTFTLTEILPQQMGMNIKAELLVDGEVADTKAEYSIKQYCMNQLETAEGELRTLLIAMLNYGAAAQAYFEENTDAPVNAELTETIPHAAIADADGVVTAPISGTANEDFKWKSAALGLFDDLCIRFKFYAADLTGLTVEIAGQTYTAESFEPAGKDLYFVIYENIVANGFATPVSACFMVDDVQIGQAVTYSVNTYLSNKADSETMGDIIQALYDYGCAASAYAATLAGGLA